MKRSCGRQRNEFVDVGIATTGNETDNVSGANITEKFDQARHFLVVNASAGECARRDGKSRM
jgi:hypothetical protein